MCFFTADEGQKPDHFGQSDDIIIKILSD